MLRQEVFVWVQLTPRVCRVCATHVQICLTTALIWEVHLQVLFLDVELIEKRAEKDLWPATNRRMQCGSSVLSCIHVCYRGQMLNKVYLSGAS